MNKHIFSLVRERPVGGLIMELYDKDNTCVSLIADQSLQFFPLQVVCMPNSGGAMNGIRGRTIELRTEYILTNCSKDTGSTTHWRTHQSSLDTCKKKEPMPIWVGSRVFQAYWGFMSEDFTTMVNESLAWPVSKVGNAGTHCVTFQRRGLFEIDKLATDHAPRHHLQDFAKALQWRLQALLVEVNDSDHTAFLLLRFILIFFLLKHEWAKESRQEPIFLKLDFNKAYGRIEWTCMFQVMGKLGMSNSFITMIRVLFYDAMVSIYINNQATEPLNSIEEFSMVAL